MSYRDDGHGCVEGTGEGRNRLRLRPGTGASLAARIAREGAQDRELSAALRAYANAGTTGGVGPGHAVYRLYAAAAERGVPMVPVPREDAAALADSVDKHGALTAYRLAGVSLDNA